MTRRRGTAAHRPPQTLRAKAVSHASLRLLRLSAEQGLSAAQSRLGVLCAKGLGVPKDEKAAKVWWEQAAAQGHPNAVKYLEQGKLSSDEDE